MNKKLLLLVTLMFLFALVTIGEDNKPGTSRQINVYCNEDNDLYQLLVSGGQDCRRYEDIDNALEQCKKNEVLLVLAKDYPKKKTIIPESFYKIARDKNLKLYINVV